MTERSPVPLVGVGASAGGVEALSRFVAHLPADLPAAVLVVLHMLPEGHSVLASILDRAGPLPAHAARDGAPLVAGEIIVACPDCHLMVEDGTVRTARGPRENGHRPAIDPLLRSLALHAGPAAIAVILSGTRDDGTLGAGAVKAAGGHVFVQEPTDALYPDMPESVLRAVAVDGQGTAPELAARVAEALGSSPTPVEELVAMPQSHEPGESGASGLMCPDCGGAIWADTPAGVSSFNCHTGHRYSADSLLDEQGSATETALWVAIRHLEERAVLLRRMAASVAERGPVGARRFSAAADESKRHADTIRELVVAGQAEP